MCVRVWVWRLSDVSCCINKMLTILTLCVHVEIVNCGEKKKWKIRSFFWPIHGISATEKICMNRWYVRCTRSIHRFRRPNIDRVVYLHCRIGRLFSCSPPASICFFSRPHFYLFCATKSHEIYTWFGLASRGCRSLHTWTTSIIIIARLLLFAT